MGLKARAAALWDRLPGSRIEIALLWVAGLLLGVLAFRSALALALPLALAGWAGAAGLALLLARRAEPLLWEAPAPDADRASEPPAEPPVRPPVPPLLDLVEIPGGTFLMGSPPASEGQIADYARRWGEPLGKTPEERIERVADWLARERPARRVRLSPFRMARLPVTRAQWRAVMAEAPGDWSRTGDDGDLPATDIDWVQALAFCNAVSAREGLAPCYRRDDAGAWHWERGADGYRLPTEAEWEYACRAGTETQWFWGDDPEGVDDHAWYAGNSQGRLHPAGAKSANPWGLRDMAGLVWEWCWDRYGAYPQATEPPAQDPAGPLDGGSRVVRGGSFGDPPELLRSAGRVDFRPDGRLANLGLRCVRSRAR